MAETVVPWVSPAAFVGVVLRRQTYKNLLYISIAFPLGIIYGSVLTIGLVFGLVFAVVLVGIVVLVGVVIAARGLAGIERWLANALLRVELRAPTDVGTGEGPIHSAKGYLDAPSTWRGLGFLSVKFWIGVVGLVLLVFLVRALELVLSPVRYPSTVEFGELNEQPLVWSIETLPEAGLAAVVGLVGGLVVIHLINGVGYVSEQIAGALLDGFDDRSTTEQSRQ